MNEVLLHVCCACCSTEAIERLKKDYSVVLFFSNSNIDCLEEFNKRLENAKKIAKVHSLKLIVDDYNHDMWLDFIKGLEFEPERGERCLNCFEFNLKRTASKALELEVFGFTTTLTISPHKNSNVIFDIGRRIGESGGVKFLEINFKKQEGFKHSLKLSKKYGLYRQNYCGCEFSKNIESPKE
jgi:epoxyqueuosine reductase